jgi:pimeloyl-ACP methyl ester carboxylesterase
MKHLSRLLLPLLVPLALGIFPNGTLMSPEPELSPTRARVDLHLHAFSDRWKNPATLRRQPAELAIVSQEPAPGPIGTLVDIGGQRIHLNCTGQGSPTVLLESGTGDVSVIWALVQPGVSKFTRVCSYDRAGYAWSEPGSVPRTFAQLALEFQTALTNLHVDPPYVLVGQSYGGLVIRGFARQYRTEVVGMVMVDSVHEDQRVVYGGQPHRIRDGAKGRLFPSPRIALDAEVLRQARQEASNASNEPLEPPLDRLPVDAQAVWRWAEGQPLLRLAQQAELEWSPEELARMHQERLRNRTSLGQLPLIVLARTRGGYPDGMSISADDLEKERKALQADLARLSRKGELIYARDSGHNIHLEDPRLVIRSIRAVVNQSRRSTVQGERHHRTRAN